MLKPAISRPTISPRFFAILALFFVFGAGLFTGRVDSSIFVVAFVFAGWVISLCLHEAGHALAAYFGGDRSVVEKGYLSLDPLAYAHPAMTFGLPLLYLFMGGIGLPGGAVYIDHRVLKSRAWDSAVSAAGPAANMLCLAAITLPFVAGLPDGFGAPAFWGALAFLGWLQVTAIVLNLLPIPGLDGFGIIAPHLPYDMQQQAKVIASGLSIMLLFLMTTPHFNHAIANASDKIADRIGLDTDYAYYGYRLFRFKE